MISRQNMSPNPDENGALPRFGHRKGRTQRTNQPHALADLGLGKQRRTSAVDFVENLYVGTASEGHRSIDRHRARQQRIVAPDRCERTRGQHDELTGSKVAKPRAVKRHAPVRPALNLCLIRQDPSVDSQRQGRSEFFLRSVGRRGQSGSPSVCGPVLAAFEVRRRNSSASSPSR